VSPLSARHPVRDTFVALAVVLVFAMAAWAIAWALAFEAGLIYRGLWDGWRAAMDVFS
jgi:hypothetical protein